MFVQEQNNLNQSLLLNYSYAADRIGVVSQGRKENLMLKTTVSVIKLLLPLLSIMGYVVYITVKWKVRVEFSPAIVVSTIGVIMLFAGILNVMLATTYLIILIGICLLITLCVKNRNINKIIFSPSNLFLLAVGALLTWRLYKTMSFHYDDFSHWQLVVKYVLRYDALPSYKSNIIGFNAYPTGVAGFIYYVLRLIGFREDLSILTQAVLTLVYFLPVLVFVNKRSILNWVAAIILFLTLFAQNIVFGTMLVDDLLAFVAIACFAIIIYYKNEIKKATLCLMPICIFLVLIKNSGFFFIAALALLTIINSRKNNNLKKDALYIIGFTLKIPALIFYLWTRHVQYLFWDGMSSKHALNISSYASYFKTQSWEELKVRFVEVMKRMVDINNASVRNLVIITTIALVITILVYAKDKKIILRRYICCLLYSTFIYFLYGISLVGLYSTSMKGYESEILAGFYRYQRTIILAICGYFVVLILKAIKLYSNSFR